MQVYKISHIPNAGSVFYPELTVKDSDFSRNDSPTAKNLSKHNPLLILTKPAPFFLLDNASPSFNHEGCPISKLRKACFKTRHLTNATAHLGNSF